MIVHTQRRSDPIPPRRSPQGPVFLALLVAAAILAAGAADERGGWDFRSRQAQAAKRRYDEAAARAGQEYGRKMAAAREAAAKDLNEAIRAATKAGDLDEANKIKRALDELNQDAGTPAAPARGPVGRWEMRYSNGVRRDYEIRPDGAVAWSNPTNAGKGRLERIDGGWLMPNDGDGNAERLTLAGDRLFIEHFHPASKYPKQGTDILAVGERAKAAR